jgi:site-specific DNA-methyltransferase (adenine-specific)/adenine-specific DNA-methyltransferase
MVETFPRQPTESIAPSALSPANGWYNRLICGDKSNVLLALLPEFARAIDLIYIDPPFMTGRDFTSDKQLAYSDKWKNDLDVYLQWLYETFSLLHLLLAEHGSLYVHLDWRATHYAKIMLDEIFGVSPHAEGVGFKSEIIWHYQTGGRSYKTYARKHDTILLYTKSARYCFHGERIGERRGSQKRNHMRKRINSDGHITWTIRSAGRLYTYDEDTVMTPSDVWSDISHLHQKDPERNGYATQKPSALLERIILASSEEGDLVLDCFCGSGVTPVVAERLGRRWIASDQSSLAMQVTQKRLLAQEQCGPFILQRI